MSWETRRVHHLRLRAPHRELVRRGVILLEDAFHTAPLPWAQTARLYLVRRLALGRISVSRSPQKIERILRQRLGDLKVAAVHAESAVTEQDAVYFHDAAEPYICLAARIAAGRVPRQWFWPLAAPPWHPEMDRHAALRALLAGVMETESGPAAAIRMLQRLQDETLLDALLEALEPGEGPCLLRQFNWTSSLSSALASPNRHTLLPEIEPRWHAVLERWIPRWGAADHRSVWLAAAAMTADQPSRLLAPDIVMRAEQIATAFGYRATGTKRAASESGDIPAAETTERADPEAGKRHSVAEPARTTDSPAVSKASAAAGAKTNRHRARPPVPADTPRPSGSHARSAEQTRSGDGPSSTRQRAATPARPVGPVGPATEETPVPADAVAAGPDVHRAPVSEAPSPLRTEHGGLFFLVPVMSQLGIDAFLQQQPQYIEHEFPVRLLRFVGEHLGVLPDDPVLCAVAPPDSDPPTAVRFDPPQTWQSFMKCRTGTSARRSSCDGQECPSYGGDGQECPSYGSDGQECPSYGMSFDDVLHTWLGAMQAWCYRHAEMELAVIVHRPARILGTPTHVDVLLELRQADVRIRRAGWDLDPGWVPWLGRVVAFHYLYGDRIDE